MRSESRQILVAWTRQFGLALALYFAALLISVWAATANIAPFERTAFVLAPIVPGLALIWLTADSYSRSDEYIQQRMLHAASLATIVVAAFVLVYAFLEILGLPRLSMLWISNLIWGVFVAQMLKLLVTGK